MPTSSPFQPGDQVRLKSATSGRPLMVASVVGSGSHVLCRPTDANGNMILSLEEARLLATTLLKKV